MRGCGWSSCRVTSPQSTCGRNTIGLYSLVDGLVSFTQPWQPSDRAVPMTSLTRKKRRRRPRCWLTVGSAQVIIAVVCLILGVFVTAFRFSVQARLYGYKTLIHGMAEDSALKQAHEQAQEARTCFEVAQLIARDSRLDADRYNHACTASLVREAPPSRSSVATDLDAQRSGAPGCLASARRRRESLHTGIGSFEAEIRVSGTSQAEV